MQSDFGIARWKECIGCCRNFAVKAFTHVLHGIGAYFFPPKLVVLPLNALMFKVHALEPKLVVLPLKALMLRLNLDSFSKLSIVVVGSNVVCTHSQLR